MLQRGLIDSWGRGTLKIIDTCKAAELPEPELTERDGGFVVTLFKDNLTEEQLVKLGQNNRQINAVIYVKENGRITNSEYQKLNETSERTASRDLEELYKLNILDRVGESKSTSYVIKVGGYDS